MYNETKRVDLNYYYYYCVVTISFTFGNGCWYQYYDLPIRGINVADPELPLGR